MILILRKDKYILGRIGLYFWGFEEKLNYFRDLGREGKYFLGDEDIICRDTGRSMRYFQGSREHRPPWGPHSYKRLGDFFNVGYIVCVEGGGLCGLYSLK